MSLINRMLYEPPGGQFREYIGINAFFEPNDLSIYQKFIPKPFIMPERPVVFIFAADYMKVVRWPLSRYQEWAVLLKCNWESMEGWYCITMPVTKWLPMMGGRNLGFPKYVVDSITLTRRNQGWIAQGMNKGSLQVSFVFQPGLTRSLGPWENELMEDESFFKNGETFQLVPPSQGPHVNHIHLENVVTPQWSPEPGMVHLEVDPGEPWAGLVPSDSSFPGSFNHFKGGVNIIVVS